MKYSIAERAENLALTPASVLGVVLWNVEFVKEGASYFLRYYIDKEGGVSIDDCEAFSRMIDPMLDDADFIDKSYCLEVSSPGIERTLAKDWHFQNYINKQVKIRLIRPVDGKKEIVGTLLSFSDGIITVDSESENISVKQAETAWVKACDTEI